MKKLILLPIMALFIAAGTGCEEGSDTEYKDPACTSSYNGPTKDIQIDAFCNKRIPSFAMKANPKPARK